MQSLLLTNIVEQLGLDKSQYPPGQDGVNKLLVDLAKKATENGPPTAKKLGLPSRAVISLTAISLYDVIILADDSGSMKTRRNGKSRFSTLKDTIYNLAPIARDINEEGISLRFINHRTEDYFDNLKDRTMIDKVLNNVTPNDATPIGTSLQRKVLQPLLKRAKDGELKRPALIVIITDGEPNWEPPDTLKHTIIDCKRQMKDELSYSGTEIIFAISYVGTDPSAKRYVEKIEKDPMVKDLLYCSLENIENLVNNRAPGKASDNLLKLLRNAIVKAPMSK